MPTVSECIFYSILNYLPYVLLAFYPLRFFLRYSHLGNILIISMSQFFQTVLILLGVFVIPNYTDALSVLSLFISLAVYFIAFKAYFGRMLFNLLMLTNIANCVIICSKYLEKQIFPDAIYERYNWSFSICMIVVQLLLLTPFFLYVKYMIDNKFQGHLYKTAWRYAWIIPGILYIVWYYMFYYTTGKSSLEMSLNLSTVIFSLIIVVGQCILYSYVSTLNSTFLKVMELEEAAYHGSIQSLQYKNIQEQIKETRTLRHDMRHNINILLSYAENNQFEELKNYLKDYASTITDYSRLNLSENSALNLVLSYYADHCKSLQIPFNVKCVIPEDLPFSEKEVAVLFGNLLENAYDACKAMPETQPRFINFSGRQVQNQLFFVIENTFSNTISKTKDDQFVSTKHTGNGIGTSSSKNIVTNNGGSIRFDILNDVFRVSIILPLKATE